MKKLSKKKIIINIIVVAIILGIVLFLTLNFSDMKQIRQTIYSMQVKYALIALLLIVLSSMFSGLSATILVYDKNPKIGFSNAFLINNTENFFNGITPFASGSQPFQAYYYMKKGVDGDDTTSVLLSNTIIYSILLTIASTISILVGYKDLSSVLTNRMYVVYIGWMFNLLFTIGILMLVYVKSFYKLVISIFKILSRIKVLKNRMDRLIEKTPEFVFSYQESVKLLFKKPKIFIPAVLSKLLSIIFFHIVTFMLAKALNFGVTYRDFTYIFTASIVATSLMAWFPLPGASGGTEGSLFVLFKNYSINNVELTNSQVATYLIFIRLFTYYIAMFYGFIVLLIFIAFEFKNHRKHENYSKKLIYKLTNKKPLSINYYTDVYDKNIIKKIKEMYPNSLINIFSSRKINSLKKNVDYRYIPLFRLFDKSFLYYFLSVIFKILVLRKKNEKSDIIITDSKLSIGLYSTIFANFYKIPLITIINKTKSFDFIDRKLFNFRIKFIIYKSDLQFITSKSEYDYLLSKKIKLKNAILYNKDVETKSLKSIIYEKTQIAKIIEKNSIYKVSYLFENKRETFYIKDKNIIFK